jgi:DNA-binding transcriptional MerR regulator
MSGWLYSIGEVSRITGLSVKALRLYHEKGLLAPSRIDAGSGYRYYTEPDVARAHAIRALRDLGLSMDESRTLLDGLDTGAALGEQLGRVQERLAAERASLERAQSAITALLRNEAQARDYLRSPPPVVVRKLGAVRAAVHRARGRYSDAQEVFPRLFAAVGPAVAGPAFCLLHETDYREEGADLSWCVPVAEGARPEGVSVEEVPEVLAATVLHRGPWDAVGLGWARLFAHVHTQGGAPTGPLREVYLRGPAEAAPSDYLTELAIPFA